MFLQTRDLQAVLSPIVERLQNLETQESLNKTYYRQDSFGNFYMSRNPEAQGRSDILMSDFKMDLQNQKLSVRALVMAELDNRVQVIGARYVGTGDGYTIANGTVIQGDLLMSMIGAGAVAGMVANGTRPDWSMAAGVSFWPDSPHMPWTSTNTPGMIAFDTVSPGQAGFGGNFSTNHSTTMDSSGLWLMGIQGGGAPVSEHAIYVARLNLRSTDTANSSFSALRMFHSHDPSAGELGQGIDWSFFMRGNSGAGMTWLEAARIDLAKLADFTTFANQNSQLRLRILTGGLLEARLSLYPAAVELHAQALLVSAAADRASLRMPSSGGGGPSSPVDGDMWYDGTNLKFRHGGTTRTLTWV